MPKRIHCCKIIVSALIFQFWTCNANAQKVVETYTVSISQTKVAVVKCPNTKVGGVDFEGQKLKFSFEKIKKEWCFNAYTCEKSLKKIAKHWCKALK